MEGDFLIKVFKNIILYDKILESFSLKIRNRARNPILINYVHNLLEVLAKYNK